MNVLENLVGILELGVCLSLWEIVLFFQLACRIVSIATHYFLSASFCWMLAEGIHIYNKIVRVFGSKKYNRVFCVLGWGKEKSFFFLPELSLSFAKSMKAFAFCITTHPFIHLFSLSLFFFLSCSFFLLVLSFRRSSSSCLGFSWCFIPWIRTLQCVNMFIYAVFRAYFRQKNNWKIRGSSNCQESPSCLLRHGIWLEGFFSSLLQFSIFISMASVASKKRREKQTTIEEVSSFLLCYFSCWLSGKFLWIFAAPVLFVIAVRVSFSLVM